MKTGKVFLVGAGPGDIGLITVKGLEAIKRPKSFYMTGLPIQSYWNLPRLIVN
ncbi:hypothetical protein NDK43_32545 [Neobacillus pocheonensis]|uniref:Tetrapyrrole methylase domain-containing protein n=1 Tax=Neobacillus pocheonensis TaxID=363869 RepID=A0ABT0WIJ7_9BACI|nr:hypothetical protein [Neobacillus pocheonensis]